MRYAVQASVAMYKAFVAKRADSGCGRQSGPYTPFQKASNHAAAMATLFVCEKCGIGTSFGRRLLVFASASAAVRPP